MSPPKKAPSVPGPGSIVLVHLREPREKLWGMLLSLEVPGLWIRGLDVNSFEDWARQLGKGEDGGIAPTTVFVPHLRLEKLALDEPMPPVPSMGERFEQMAGMAPGAALGGRR